MRRKGWLSCSGVQPELSSRHAAGYNHNNLGCGTPVAANAANDQQLVAGTDEQ
jgi:hypothetical protein